MRSWLRRYWPYLIVAVIGTAVAFVQIASQFSPWDDEGYLVSSVAEFLRGGSLYNDIYTQYGPFYYLLFGGLSKVTGIAPTNDAGRVISTLIWSATALSMGLLADRVNRSRSIGLLVTLAAFSVPFVVREPMHPVGICTLLVVLIIVASAWGDGLDTRRGAILAGVALGALVMIKINMGALAALGLVGAALLTAAPARWRSLCGVVATVLLLLGPLALMSGDFSQGWAKETLVMMFAALAAIVVTAWPVGEADRAGPGLRTILVWIAAGTAAICAITVIVIVIAGTPPSAVIDGVLVDPTHHPGIDFIPFPLPRQVVFWSVIALAAAVLARERRRFYKPDALIARGLARLIAAAAMTLAVISIDFLGKDSMLVAIPVLLAWLGARGPAELTSRIGALRRLALVLVASLELLQAYPVAGSQLLAGELPLILVAALIAGDGLGLLALARAQAPARDSRVRAATYVVGAITAAVIIITGIIEPGHDAGGAYRANRVPHLHGMSLSRLPPGQAAGYEQLTDALKKCDTFVTYPGMSSFYLWANKPSPTRFNVANWMLLVGDKRQRRALDRIKDNPGLCVLRNDALAQIRLIASRPSQHGPLIKYLNTTPLRDELIITANGFGNYRVQVRAR